MADALRAYCLGPAGDPALLSACADQLPARDVGPVVPELPALTVEPSRRPRRRRAFTGCPAGGAHVAGHIPGCSIPLDGSFGTWLGCRRPRPAEARKLLVEREADLDELTRQAPDGHDETRLPGGRLGAAAGRPVETSGRCTTTSGSRAGRRPGDPPARPTSARRRAWRLHAGCGHHGGSLTDRLSELPRDRPIATMCAAGFRASIGASLLRAAGFEDVAWVDRGFPVWEAAGHPVERGGAAGRGPA
jgi:hydroxyacylglutathione hydrolase